MKIDQNLANTIGYNIRVTHFAQSHRNFAATSFSHPFYLVSKENPKKVEKSCHLGVPVDPPWFMY